MIGVYVVYTWFKRQNQDFRINTVLSLGCSLHVSTFIDVNSFFWDFVGASHTLKIRINLQIHMNIGVT